MIVVPGRVCHRRLVLHPGETLLVEPADWADTLVVVVSGMLQLACHSGRRANLAAESMLTLDGLPVRILHNPGVEDVILHVVCRDR